MNFQTLEKFKRWYNIVVLVIIGALAVAAYINYGKSASMLYGCFAILAGLMLVATNMIIKQLLPKGKNNKFRNHK